MSKQKAARVAPTGWVLGNVNPGKLNTEFFLSWEGTRHHDRVSGRRFERGGTIFRTSSSRLAQARNKVMADFKARMDQHGWEWLCWADSDMSWAPDAWHRMIAAAERHGCGVMGGLYFGGVMGSVDTMFPQIYRLKAEADALENMELEGIKIYPRGGVLMVDGIGAGAMVVHRSVISKMAAKFATTHDGYDNPHKWFQEAVFKGKDYGEDIVFCLRARQCGFKVGIHTGISFGHEKSNVYTEDMYREKIIAETGDDLPEADIDGAYWSSGMINPGELDDGEIVPLMEEVPA